MPSNFKYLVQIHIAVFLFGFASLFPKLINLSSITIVWGRVLFSSLALFLIIKIRKSEFNFSKKYILPVLITGLILSIHWTTFFQSIKISSISIGVLSFSTFPLILSFLEPIFFKEKFSKINLFYAILGLLGISLLIPKIDLSNNIFRGIIWGLISAITYAFMLLLNRFLLKKIRILNLVFLQNFTAFIILSFFYLKNFERINLTDTFYLIILGIIGTALAHTFFINGLKKIKAYNAGIINCLELIYAIIFSVIVFKSYPTIREIFGGLILLFISYQVSAKKKNLLKKEINQ